VFRDVELKEYYPTVGLHSLNETVTLNFGLKPWKFNIDRMILNQKQEGIKSILQQEISPFDVHKIVHSYLYFNGFFDTLASFEKTTQITRGETCLAKKLDVQALENARGEELEEESIVNNPSTLNGGREFDEIPARKSGSILNSKRFSLKQAS
jgi:hypothetical protein